MAATESPPPTMEVAPLVVASATARAMPSVPLANWGFSNTPIGPFQTMVFAFAISELNSSMVFGPMSRPIQPSGVSAMSGGFCAGGFEGFRENVVDGKDQAEFALLGFGEQVLRARSSLSFSTSDFPIGSLAI